MRLRREEKDLRGLNFDVEKNESAIFDNRIHFANNITNLINNIDDGITISIDAKWGEGKTEFLRVLERRLEKEEKVEVIFFDAFKNDFFDNPFSPISLEIQEKFKDNTSFIDKFIGASGKIAKGLFDFAGDTGSRFLLNLYTLGAVKNEDVSKLAEKIENAWEDGNNILSEEQLNNCKKYKILQKTQDDLKDAFKEITKEKKIVFMIDELDRCSPDYAIKVLETIKHFFEIDGVTFVIGMNQEQISEYFNGKCGNTGGSDYLKKFINFECVLPSNKSDNLKGDIGKFVENLRAYHIESMNKESNGFRAISRFNINHLIQIISYLNFTLREIEDFFRNLVITYSYYNGDITDLNIELVFIFLAIKIKNPKLFKYIKEENAPERSMEMENFIERKPRGALPDKGGSFFLQDFSIIFFSTFSGNYERYYSFDLHSHPVI